MELCVYEQVVPLRERVRARFQGQDGYKLQCAAAKWAKKHGMSAARTFIDVPPAESRDCARHSIEVSGYADAPVLTVR